MALSIPSFPTASRPGTYAMAAAMTGGEVFLDGARGDLLQEALQTLRSTGVEIEEKPTGIRVARNGGGLQRGRRSRPSPSRAFPPTCRPSSSR